MSSPAIDCAQFSAEPSGSVYTVRFDFPEELFTTADGEPAHMVANIWEPNTAKALPGGKFPTVLEAHAFIFDKEEEDGSGSDDDLKSLGGLNRVDFLVEAGYMVISVDQLGHGASSSGSSTFANGYRMDDGGQAGAFVFDTIEACLPYTLRDERGHLVVGSVGPDMAGATQHAILAADAKMRLRALVPEMTWNNVYNSYYPNDVWKSGYDSIFDVVPGTLNGTGPTENYNKELINGRIDAETRARVSNRLSYTSPDYYAGIPEGREPVSETFGKFSPGAYKRNVEAQRFPWVMYWQGPRDTLFPLVESVRNFRTMRSLSEQADDGSKVFHMTYQHSHEYLFPRVSSSTASDGINPAPGSALGTFNDVCGDLAYETAVVGFFDRVLKGDENALIDAIGHEDEDLLCWSLDSLTDAVWSQGLPQPEFEFDFSLTLPLRPPVLNTPLAYVEVPLPPLSSGTYVVAGTSFIDLDIASLGILDYLDDTTVFAGFGTGIGYPTNSPLDAQVTPIEAPTATNLEMVGASTRVPAGESLFLIFENHDQTFVLNRDRDGVAAVQLSGTVRIPILAPEANEELGIAQYFEQSDILAGNVPEPLTDAPTYSSASSNNNNINDNSIDSGSSGLSATESMALGMGAVALLAGVAGFAIGRWVSGRKSFDAARAQIQEAEAASSV